MVIGGPGVKDATRGSGGGEDPWLGRRGGEAEEMSHESGEQEERAEPEGGGEAVEAGAFSGEEVPDLSGGTTGGEVGSGGPTAGGVVFDGLDPDPQAGKGGGPGAAERTSRAEGGDVPGSEVSPGYLLQDCNVQGLLCNQLLQPLVFFLNFFEP